jgi:aromatic-L-amino-acid/L-tryptophan decarboxylase
VLVVDNIPVEDYRQLAQKFDWEDLILSIYHRSIQDIDNPTLTILDVACGTGRWLQTFQHYIPLKLPNTKPIQISYDLLDYSENALLEASEKINYPLELGSQYVSKIQETELSIDFYNLIWSMHGFYAIPRSDLIPTLTKILNSLNEEGTCFIAQANRESFYVSFYEKYLQLFHDGERQLFTSAEDIIEALVALGVDYQVHIIRYDERIAVNDMEALEHYIFHEATINSFSKEDSVEVQSSIVNITLEDLLNHQEMGKYLNSLIKNSVYHFPEEIWLISFSKKNQQSYHQKSNKSNKPIANNTNNPLLQNGRDMVRLVETAMKFIIPCQENAESFPLNGSGFQWLHLGEINSEVDSAIQLAQSVVEDLPEEGNSNFEVLLRDLFEQLAPCSMNTNSGGYLGFIPSGGLFHSALADFIALSLNRYVPIFMAAPGLAAIETQTIRWLCDIVGLPLEAGGTITSGGSVATLTAIHTARSSKISNHAPEKLLKATAYVSEQAHHCLAQGFIICGFPQQNIREIPVDRNFRIRLDILEETIKQDIFEGFEPFFVSATAGTTNTGAVDNLWEIEKLARRYSLWFHVDAAYGGFFRMTQRGATILKGIEQADSVVIDPHKSLFLPYGTGALLVKDRSKLKIAFDFTGSYLPSSRDVENSLIDDMMHLSPELTKEFRGLRIWLPLKMLGIKVFREQLEQKLDLAQWVTEQLLQIPNIRIVAHPQLSVLAFKLDPPGYNLEPKFLDILNREFLDAINQPGNILLSPFRGSHNKDGEFCIRMAILSFRTTSTHLTQGIVDIRNAAREVLEKFEITLT